MKRLKNIVASKNATQKKNNKGMTYIELLVALSLLVLIVTMFSPMLMRTYDSLYKAGEIAKSAYDARSEIEKELAFRENNDSVSLTTNFEKLSDSINVAARQIISSTSGLTTLYGEARGRLKVVSDNVVSDNQDYQSIRLLATNLDKDKYIRSGSIDAAQNPADDEVQFYIHGVFNDAEQLDYTITKVPNSSYIDILLKNVDVTKGPVKFLAYYRDTFDKVKKAEAYLYIEPADMIFVGDSGTNDFYTSAGVDKEGNFYIAGRQMSTAPINGETLRDVEWVGTDNDSTILDGYYIMCGDNSVVRRLWRARDSSKSANIAYKSTAINGAAYFLYDWKGDYTDRYTHISKKGAGDSGYGSSSTANSDSTVKDFYSLAGSHYAFSYNGHAGNWTERDQMSRRISYIAYTNQEIAKADGHEPLMGMWSRYTNRSTKDQDVFNAKDTDLAYSPSDNQWYQRKTSGLFNQNVNWNATGIYGADNWINEWNMRDTANPPFNFRNGVPSGKAIWDGTSGHENRTGDVDHDEEIAYITLKIYNNYSKENLGVTADDAMPAAPANNLVQLTSCTVLPGKSGDTIYFGRTHANALIQQTNATASEGSLGGLFTAYPVISQKNSAGEPEMRYNVHTQEMDMLTLATTGSSSVQPRSEFGAEQYAAHAYTNTSWGYKYDDVYFTMGYASDLYALYNSFTDADTKPLEASYMASNGYTATHSKVTDSIWLPRNFYNIVESDNFGHSVVAVGYNFAGKIGINYNELYIGNNDGYDYAYLSYKNGGSFSNSSNWRPTTTASDFTHVVKNTDNTKYILGSFTNTKSDYWLKLPKAVVASTALNKVFNDGVISVYNEGDASFTNIYYYREPTEASVRFDCVSAFALSDTVVGAAVGVSNGTIMLAQIPYADGRLAQTTLSAATCPVAPAIADISSITAIKGVNCDIDGDDTPETLILAGGVRANGKPLVLRVCDANDLSTYYAIQIQASSSVTKVTDIAIVNGYIYVSAIQSDNSGVIFACELKELKKLQGKGSNTVVNLVTNVNWKVKTGYDTTYGVNDEGLVVGVGAEIRLPAIYAIAGKTEQ